MAEWSITFGELEAALSELHDVAGPRRTAFQARLKNFHRLNFPHDFETVKGKAGRYTPAHTYELALAVELTQLGLPPERATTVLSWNRYETAMAATVATRTLQDWRTDNSEPPLQMFVYFDPYALAPLTYAPDDGPTADAQSFYFGSAAAIADFLKLFEPQASPRLSLVNVTALIAALDKHLPDGFLDALFAWASAVDAPQYGSIDYATIQLKDARRHGLKSQTYQRALVHFLESRNGRPQA